MREHFQLILDALQVGLDNEDVPTVQVELPTLLPALPPPTSVRAIIHLDESAYSVTIEQVARGDEPARECPKSAHGRHTFSQGACIGCGEKQS